MDDMAMVRDGERQGLGFRHRGVLRHRNRTAVLFAIIVAIAAATVVVVHHNRSRVRVFHV